MEALEFKKQQQQKPQQQQQKCTTFFFSPQRAAPITPERLPGLLTISPLPSLWIQPVKLDCIPKSAGKVCLTLVM